MGAVNDENGGGRPTSHSDFRVVPGVRVWACLSGAAGFTGG